MKENPVTQLPSYPEKFTFNLAVVKDFDKHQNILCTHKPACDMISINTESYNYIHDDRLLEDRVINKIAINHHIINHLFSQGLLKKNIISSVQQHFIRYSKTPIYLLKETQKIKSLFEK